MENVAVDGGRVVRLEFRPSPNVDQDQRSLNQLVGHRVFSGWIPGSGDLPRKQFWGRRYLGFDKFGRQLETDQRAR